MTSIRAVRTATGILVGTRPAFPEQTAMLEARGAMLFWDVLESRVFPSAEIHDADAAGDWLWEIYGADAAAAVLAVVAGNTPEEIDLPEPETDAVADAVADDAADASAGYPVLAAARQLAHIAWAGAWWPASTIAGVPPLSRALLGAEAPVLTAACEHLLDDVEAAQRALAAASESVPMLQALTDDSTLAARAQALLGRLLDVAETFGVELPGTESLESETADAEPGAKATSDDFALAAGSGTGLLATSDVAVQRGATALDWYDFPVAMIDAASEASWTISRRSEATVLEVVVQTAPLVTFPLQEKTHQGSLIAHFAAGDVSVSFDLHPDETGDFRGEAALPVSSLLVTPEKRMLRILSPDVASQRSSNDALGSSAGDSDTAGTADAVELSALRVEIAAEARRRISLDPGSLAESVAARASERGWA